MRRLSCMCAVGAGEMRLDVDLSHEDAYRMVCVLRKQAAPTV